MYVLDGESAAEKWCQANQVTTPKLASLDDVVGFVNGESRYRVERSFDRLPQGFREFLLNDIAKVDMGDLKSIHCSGTKLHHYTEQGQRKIARAFRKVRLLSKMFPEGVTEREFTLIERRQGD